ncbi:upstream transcription factor 1 [Echinococcus multilocularis]|uniref:Upstream transcription factor 1 n=1 Tax=Echinococcus multilocularis TaxID=6211 RepID=A0A068XW05_ECHMU|nr:upstream transcription factor 1 [Echinococcus multilocularis]
MTAFGPEFLRLAMDTSDGRCNFPVHKSIPYMRTLLDFAITFVVMDSVPNNDYAPTSSQIHLGGTSYISGCNLFTHFANLTSQDRPKSKSPNPHAIANNNSKSTTCADIYSAILSSQQQQGVIDETSVAFTSPTRHLSEPSTAAARRSPIDDQMECTPRSCHTSPSVAIKSFHHHLQRSSPPHSLDSSPNNGLEPSHHQSNTNTNPSSVISLTQSGLQELMRKSGSVISTEEIKKANNSSQLYLLVPSNYPVIMAVGAEREKAAAAAVAAVTVNEATTRNLLERFQLTSAPTPQQQQSLPSPQITVEQQQQQSQTQQKQTVMPRAPRKNSTNIPPMLLQSLKDVVPSLAFRDILESGGGVSSTPGSDNKSDSGGGGSTTTTTNPLPRLSSIAFAYGFPSTNDHKSTSTSPSSVNATEDRKKSTDPTAALLISPPQASQAPPSASTSSSFLLDDYRGGGGPPEVKIKPPPPSTSATEAGLCVEGLLGSDSNVFFSNDSPPTRNYMGRIGGAGCSGALGGGGQGNQTGGDSKDIRRRVSHNEVERRRRDRINTWIAALYKLLPPEQQAKSQYQSKGVVLKRVYEYFQNYDSNIKTLREENAIFKQEICRLTRENHILRDSLKAHFQQQQQQSATVTTGLSTPCEVSQGKPFIQPSFPFSPLPPCLTLVFHITHLPSHPSTCQSARSFPRSFVRSRVCVCVCNLLG